MKKIFSKINHNLFLFLWLGAILPLLTAAAIQPSFNLAFSGDDWNMFYYIWSILDIQKISSYYNPMTYVCTYCPHFLTLSAIKYFWGYDPYYYYLVSYLTRLGVAITIYFVMVKISKNKTAGLFASMFYSVTYIGIETTDWVFNFTHYIGVIFAGIFLISYFKLKESSRLINYLIPPLLFALALLISPPRMHGLFPLVILVEIIWFFLEGKKYNFKQTIIRLVLLLVVYRVVISSGDYGTGLYMGMIQKSLAESQLMINNSRTDFLLNPIITIGNYLLPGQTWTNLHFENWSFFNKPSFTFTSYLLPLAAVITTFGVSILYLFKTPRSINIAFLITQIAWLFIVNIIRKFNQNTLGYPELAYMLCGGYAIILSIWLFFILKSKYSMLSQSIAIGMGWIISFTFFPWLLAPYAYLQASGRYSLHQGVGLSIWMATLLVIILIGLKNRSLSILTPFIYILAGLFVYFHLTLTYTFLLQVGTYRNLQLDQIYWQQIISEIPSMDNNGGNIVYLQSDEISGAIAESDLRFGFFGRATLHYQVTKQDFAPFMILNQYNDLLSAVTDGKYLLKQGRNPITVPINRIYAFELKNKILTNITYQTRQRLLYDSQSLIQLNQLTPPISP